MGKTACGTRTYSTAIPPQYKSLCGKQKSEATSKETAIAIAKLVKADEAKGHFMVIEEKHGVVTSARLRAITYITNTPDTVFMDLKKVIAEGSEKGKLPIHHKKDNKTFFYLVDYQS